MPATATVSIDLMSILTVQIRSINLFIIMNICLLLLISITFLTSLSTAKEPAENAKPDRQRAVKEKIPSGYYPLDEWAKAKEEAVKEKKLVVLVIKGSIDNNRACENALENGLRAIGSGAIKIFTRTDTIAAADPTPFPKPLQTRMQRKFGNGAFVTLMVFDPEMATLIAEETRSNLADDREKIAAFKKTVQEAKRALK